MAGSFRIEHKGRAAAAALLLIACIFGFDIFYSKGSVEEDALSMIKNSLAVGYALEAAKGLDMSDPGQDEADTIAAALNVGIKSISVKGFTNAKAVRVEPLVNGGPPPDGRRYRYFEVEYSNIFGWQYPVETTALHYYLKLI